MTFKFILSIGVAILVTACAKQTSYSLYQTGRPLGVESNNAKKIVADNWGFELNYIGSGELSLDHKIRFNDSVNKIITEQFGENWQDKFSKESGDELIINTEIRQTVKSTDLYKQSEALLFQPVILLEKKTDNYIAHIVGQQKSDDTRKFITFAQLEVSLDGTTKVKSNKVKPLTISLPVNGIE